MAGSRPTRLFADATLDLTRVATGTQFGRIYHQRHPDALGFGKTPSRFSDPRRRSEDKRFGVLYLGSTLKVCFIEAVLRDRRNGEVGDYPIEEAELTQRHYAEIVVTSPLRLVDLRGDGPIRMGVPSDVVGATRQHLARAWSVAFHDHPVQPDGMVYSSRLNGERNVAIYDRAVSRLRAHRTSALMNAPGLAGVLNALNVALL
jgi:RES domain